MVSISGVHSVHVVITFHSMLLVAQRGPALPYVRSDARSLTVSRFAWHVRLRGRRTPGGIEVKLSM